MAEHHACGATFICACLRCGGTCEVSDGVGGRHPCAWCVPQHRRLAAELERNAALSREDGLKAKWDAVMARKADPEEFAEMLAGSVLERADKRVYSRSVYVEDAAALARVFPSVFGYVPVMEQAMRVREEAGSMTERVQETVIAGAEQRAKLIKDWVSGWKELPDNCPPAVAGAMREVLRQVPLDLERLCQEVRRLRWVHEAADELFEVAREHAFHEQARLIANGGVPFVPNRSAELVGQRLHALKQKIADGLTNTSLLGVTLDRDAKVANLERELQRMTKMRTDADRRQQGAEAALAQERARCEERLAGMGEKLRNAEVRWSAAIEGGLEADGLREEVARLKSKCNRLIGQLQLEREDRDESMARKLVKMLRGARDRS